MSTSTISTPGATAAKATAGARAISRRFSQQIWRALTPSAVGPVRGRALEAVRRVMETRLDARRLFERLPEMSAHSQAREQLWVGLLPVYRRFVARVAPPASAMSLEVAGFLADLCQQRQPQRVLELGTGFASAVLRLGTAPGWAPEIWSVDDDPARLAQTRGFLAGESLPDQRLLSWRDFAATGESGFELVIHELASTATASLAGVLDRIDAGGLLLLDGAHRTAAERDARQLLAAAGFEHWSLRALTRDCFGRHALLARR